MTSPLEDLFAFQLDSAGLTGYVREYQAIGRRFRFDFAWKKVATDRDQWRHRSKGAHSTGTGINQDYEKNNLAVLNGWRVLILIRSRSIKATLKWWSNFESEK